MISNTATTVNPKTYKNQMSRFNNPTTATSSFHPSDVYFSLEHIKCTKDEEWKPIPDFSRYEASTSGRIRDATNHELIKQNFNPDQQYYRVTLRGDDGKNGNQFVHRMIAKAFASVPLVKGDGWVVDHINHNGEDNRPCNLRAISSIANANNKRNQARYEYERQLLTVPLILAKHFGVRTSIDGVVLPAYTKLISLLKRYGGHVGSALALLEVAMPHPQYTHPHYLIA